MRRTTRRTIHGRPLLAALAGLLALTLTVPAAVADPDGDTPSQAEVDAAEDAAHDAERDVAAVQADLVMANQSLQDASVEAAQASEAYNAARWKLQQAKKAAAAADARADSAAKGLETQEASYNEMLAATYELSPDLTAMSKVVTEDGTTSMVDSANTVYNINASMGDITARYEAARTVADITADEADDAHDDAADLAADAETARRTAEQQEQAALSRATSVAAQKDDLIAELADLQDISVSLASERQSALERAAQERAARAAQAAQEEQDPVVPAADPTTATDPSDEPASADDPATTPAPDPQPDPEPSPDPQPAPEPAPAPDPTPPPSSSGAQRAIDFARAQIGEPYRWAAAGPNAWDCSGLTMKAWQSGGTYLPHYSVGQYGASTPIRSSQLKPGDLVFWGSSSSPSSIYHVALYVGNGQMIHAPRTGRDVTQESMYYWIPPNFFARP
ncbi:hypothetical protein ncot_17615 [Nocardioides sp. JQ2195]|uniref:C40 family peptidase n=1 Tax=Nocardioides sp. JQ2195 TaxID=2592334 RepID=UPI00143E3C05|nr:C40 family peptidase [Nocardioides sp. JQ2195]QIX28203.1 hypothetical protein ncot_17615 [Nocardioides sp. JQ2195]